MTEPQRFSMSTAVQLPGMPATTLRQVADRLRIGVRNASNAREFSGTDLERLVAYRAKSRGIPRP